MMTEQEAEKAYMNMINEDRPDLWNRIEAGLGESEVRQANEAEFSGTFTSQAQETETVSETPAGHEVPLMQKEGLLKKLKNTMFGGSTFRAAVSVCAICLIVGVAGSGLAGITGIGRMGSSSSVSSDEVYEAAAENYMADGDYADEASAGDYTTDGAYADEAAGSSVSDSTSSVLDDSAAGTVSDRKLIRTIDMSVETKTFDTFIEDMKAQTEAAGGYVEASTVSGTGYENESSRWAAMTIRIPKDQTDAFLEGIGDEAKVTYKDESTEDVTLTYVDIESHIEALETEEETLLGLLEKAEDMTEILEIQNELTNVRYELESYQSQLKTYDNKIDYDTITLNIQEVEEVTPYEAPGIGTRIIEGLKNSFENLGTGSQNLLVGVIVSLPYLAVFFALVYVIILIVRKIKNRRKGGK